MATQLATSQVGMVALLPADEQKLIQSLADADARAAEQPLYKE